MLTRSLQSVALALALLFLPPGTAAQDLVPVSLTLEEAMDLARRNNPGLQAVRNDEDFANWKVKSSYGALFPSASVGGGVAWQGAGEQTFGSLTAEQLGFANQPSFLFSNYSLGLGIPAQRQYADGPGTGEGGSRGNPGSVGRRGGESHLPRHAGLHRHSAANRAVAGLRTTARASRVQPSPGGSTASGRERDRSGRGSGRSGRGASRGDGPTDRQRPRDRPDKTLAANGSRLGLTFRAEHTL